MDPQSQAFTPYSSNNETWRFQSDVARIHQVQVEHAERLTRLERRQDDDARMKSVWGNSSPFPSVLSGTPQQAPLQQPPANQFQSFDDEANNLVSSLHLDTEEEPRRGMGAASRANSVRFDETANQSHFSHSARPSLDYLSRASSGFGGLSMNERSTSHKSDGRASSAHSIRSAASGRANSLNLDSAYGLGDSARSPQDTPALAPGLLLMGSVPAIIRLWMNMNFKHNSLLYAAVCTGSFQSFLDLRLIQNPGFEASIVTSAEGVQIVDLPVFFPEAVPHPASSRSSSPAPQLPQMTVNFQVVDASSSEGDSKAIQIFLGSDTLRAHSADIHFSSNSMTMFDDDRNKLSIPLVRPENEASFKSLYVSSGNPQVAAQPKSMPKEQPYLNGLVQGSSAVSMSSTIASPPPALKYRPPGVITAESSGPDSSRAGTIGSEVSSRPASRQSTTSRPSLGPLNTRAEPAEPPTASGAQNTPSRSDNSPAIWSSWRRDNPSSSAATTPAAPTSAGLDWTGASKAREPSYQRKDIGIKVLKPKSASRTVSTSTSMSTSSPSDGKSRFFDEGRRRSGLDDKPQPAGEKKEVAASAAGSSTVTTPKTRANPIGGASAFSWLNPAGSK